MNGHNGADGLVWRGKELSNKTSMTANVRLSHLLWMHDSLFSFFFSLYLLLSPCFVWATCALYSFILHKLEEAIYQKSSKNYIPQCLTKSLSSSKQQCAGMIMMTFFVDRDVSDIYFPSCLSISKGQRLPFEWFQAAGILLDVFHNEAKYTN